MRPAQSGPVERLRLHPLELAVLGPATDVRGLGLERMELLFVSDGTDGPPTDQRRLTGRLDAERRKHGNLGHAGKALGAVRIATQQDFSIAGDERAFDDGFLALLGYETRLGLGIAGLLGVAPFGQGALRAVRHALTADGGAELHHGLIEISWLLGVDEFVGPRGEQLGGG